MRKMSTQLIIMLQVLFQNLYINHKYFIKLELHHVIHKSLTSVTLEVEGMEAESTAQSSSIDKLVDASVLLESLKLGESIKCFRAGCLLLPPGANTCPFIFLNSAPKVLSFSKTCTDRYR